MTIFNKSKQTSSFKYLITNQEILVFKNCSVAPKSGREFVVI